MENRYLELSEDKFNEHKKVFVYYKLSDNQIGEKVYSPADQINFMITDTGCLYVLAKNSSQGRNHSILDVYAPGTWLNIGGTAFFSKKG